MSNKITRLISALVFAMGLTACDSEETPLELYDVQLQQTDEGISIIDADGEEMLVDADEVDLDLDLDLDASFSGPMNLSSGADADPEELSICCSMCVCTPGGTVCYGCHACGGTQQK